MNAITYQKLGLMLSASYKPDQLEPEIFWQPSWAVFDRSDRDKGSLRWKVGQGSKIYCVATMYPNCGDGKVSRCEKN